MYNTLDFPSPKYRKEKVKNSVLDKIKPMNGISPTYIARAMNIGTSLERAMPVNGLVLSFLVKPLISKTMPSIISTTAIALGNTAAISLRSAVPRQTAKERSTMTIAVKVFLFHTALFPSLNSFSG